ncbi:high-affinity lysophosphatidic acid receptor-like [Chanos chanos]|uniref:High-affinity lysophosphatidic acid receptor-like n=1 Tax=Chanos chanos TaxID=29144 RepID=A0A6J2W1H2_CHACN|nr:high-affinity lysophosphatidic acid receptor-like [Chanos chanos]
MPVCNGSALEGRGLLETNATKLQPQRYSPLPVPLKVVLSVAMVTTIAVGFLGNAIVCMIVYRKPAMRSAINMLLATLAFSDIMLSLVCMPITAVAVITPHWRFSPELCSVTVMLYWFFVLEGVAILLIISVDRFLIIVQRQDKLTPHRARLMIGSSWVLSFFIALPSMVGWAGPKPRCMQGYSESLADRSYALLLAAAVFFVPVSVMLYSYLRILNTVRRNALRIHNHASQNGLGAEPGGKLGLCALRRPPQLNVDMSFKTRAFTTILILFVGFSVCWMPHTVVSLLAVFSQRFYLSATFYPISVGALWLSYLKAVFNPIVYCWRIRKFREACLEFMPKGFRLVPRLRGRSRRRVRPCSIYVCMEAQSTV